MYTKSLYNHGESKLNFVVPKNFHPALVHI